jgi:hypothetical protein
VAAVEVSADVKGSVSGDGEFRDWDREEEGGERKESEVLEERSFESSYDCF